MLRDTLNLWKKKETAFPCPACGFWVPRGGPNDLRKGFDCPRCGKVLVIARYPSYVTALEFAVPALIAVLVARMAGALGGHFVMVALAVFFPALLLTFSEVATIFGKLEVVYPVTTPEDGNSSTCTRLPGKCGGPTDRPGDVLHLSAPPAKSKKGDQQDHK